jgi:hypothetical protein
MWSCVRRLQWIMWTNPLQIASSSDSLLCAPCLTVRGISVMLIRVCVFWQLAVGCLYRRWGRCGYKKPKLP